MKQKLGAIFLGIIFFGFISLPLVSLFLSAKAEAARRAVVIEEEFTLGNRVIKLGKYTDGDAICYVIVSGSPGYNDPAISCVPR